jgi:hypothetical protein
MKSTFIIEYNSFDRDIEMFSVGVTKTFDENGLDHNRRTGRDSSHGQSLRESNHRLENTGQLMLRYVFMWALLKRLKLWPI